MPRGAKEIVSATQRVSIARQATPKPSAPRSVRRVRQRESAPAKAAPRELVKEVAVRAPPMPVRHPTVPNAVRRDQAGFAKEIAQLNAQDDPHAIPTIDPGSRESYSKTYTMEIPSSLRGEEHGNGIITPIQRWRERGLDCYYGHYEFTYPDGAMETGDIVWPFCFDPVSDPFKQPPHPIPFPLPLAGFKLPANAQLPPIEKSVYNEWAQSTGAPSAPQ